MTDTVVEIDCGTGEETSRQLTPEEQAALDAQREQAAADAVVQGWETVRQERDTRLTGTDWLIEPWPADLSDEVQEAIHQYEVEWAAYRQALRDITDQVTDPAEVVWPLPPPAPPINYIQRQTPTIGRVAEE